MEPKISLAPNQSILALWQLRLLPINMPEQVRWFSFLWFYVLKCWSLATIPTFESLKLLLLLSWLFLLIIYIGSVGKAMRVITFEMRILFEWVFEWPTLCLNYTSRQIEGNSQMAQRFHLHLLHHMPALGSPTRIWRSVAGLQCSRLPPFCPQMSFLPLQCFIRPSVWLNSNWSKKRLHVKMYCSQRW